MPVCSEVALDLPRATSVVLSAVMVEVPASLNVADVWRADSMALQQTIISGRVAVTFVVMIKSGQIY